MHGKDTKETMTMIPRNERFHHQMHKMDSDRIRLAFFQVDNAILSATLVCPYYMMFSEHSHNSLR
jgi:hypothetical protein